MFGKNRYEKGKGRIRITKDSFTRRRMTVCVKLKLLQSEQNIPEVKHIHRYSLDDK